MFGWKRGGVETVKKGGGTGGTGEKGVKRG